MSDVTRDDLHDLRDSLTGAMREGFGSVNARLDRSNGRLSLLEQTTAAHVKAVTTLEASDRDQWSRINTLRECHGAGAASLASSGLSTRVLLGLIGLATVLAGIISALVTKMI